MRTFINVFPFFVDFSCSMHFYSKAHLFHSFLPIFFHFFLSFIILLFLLFWLFFFPDLKNFCISFHSFTSYYLHFFSLFFYIFFVSFFTLIFLSKFNKYKFFVSNYRTYHQIFLSFIFLK